MIYNPNPIPQTVVFVPLEQLTSTIDSIVQKRIREKQAEDLQEKFLSPKETSKMFSPSVSLVTLDAWVYAPVKLTTVRRFKVTTFRRSKLTTSRRSKLTS